MRMPSPAARTMAFVGLTDISGISRTVLLVPRRSYHGDSRRLLPLLDAITVRHDGCATRMLARSDFHGLRRTAPRCPFLLVAGLKKIDADLVAIDPGQFAAAIGEASGRQQQEEFLEMQSLDRA